MTSLVAATAVAVPLLLLACDRPDDRCGEGIADTSEIVSEVGTFAGTAYLLPHAVVIHDAAIDREGLVWYAAQSTGCIGVLIPATAAIHERAAAREGGTLHGLAWDEAGQGVWHGGEVGVLSLLRRDYTVERIRVSDAIRIHSLAMSDGVIWFTAERGSGFHDTRSGRTQLHATPAAPYDIVAAPGGGVWLSMPDGPALGRYSRGVTHPLEILHLPEGARPLRVAVDAIGTAWFTDWTNARLGAIQAGEDSARWFALPADAAFPRGIAATPDGHIWTYSEAAGQILRLDPANGWIDRGSVPVIGRHIVVDQRLGILWVAGGQGLAAIRFQQPASSDVRASPASQCGRCHGENPKYLADISNSSGARLSDR